MQEWWNGLNTLMKVLYCIAVPSSLLLLIQTILSLIGFDNGGSGFAESDTTGLGFDDIDAVSPHTVGDGSNPFDASTLRLFSLQGIVAFLTVFSWTSIVSIGAGTPIILGIPLGFLFGCVAMFCVAKLFMLTSKLSASGTLNINNAIGEQGTVYLPISANAKSVGKVNLCIQGQLREFNAITYAASELKTGATVRVIDLRGENLVVEKDN